MSESLDEITVVLAGSSKEKELQSLQREHDLHDLATQRLIMKLHGSSDVTEHGRDTLTFMLKGYQTLFKRSLKEVVSLEDRVAALNQQILQERVHAEKRVDAGILYYSRRI